MHHVLPCKYFKYEITLHSMNHEENVIFQETEIESFSQSPVFTA